MKKNEIAPLLISSKEMAVYLDVSLDTLRYLRNVGKVPYVQIGRRCLFSRDWLAVEGYRVPIREGVDIVGCREASRLLGISRKHLYTWTRLGCVPCQNSEGRGMTYSVSELKQWIEVQIRRTEALRRK